MKPSTIIDLLFPAVVAIAGAYLYRYGAADNLKAERACGDWLRKTAPTNNFTPDQRYDRRVGWRAGWRWYKDLPETQRDAACGRLMNKWVDEQLAHSAAYATRSFPDASPIAQGLAAAAHTRAVMGHEVWAAVKGPV